MGNRQHDGRRLYPTRDQTSPVFGRLTGSTNSARRIQLAARFYVLI
jgi:hypothetical protein